MPQNAAKRPSPPPQKRQELNLRHLRLSARTCRCKITGTSNRVDELHNKDIDHQVKYCNCGTSAGFSTD